jgi:hypothetical protein
MTYAILWVDKEYSSICYNENKKLNDKARYKAGFSRIGAVRKTLGKMKER